MAEIMPREDDDQPWNSYRRLVLSELSRIDRSLGEMNVKLAAALDVKGNEIRQLEVDMATIKTQVAAWGSVAGIIGGALVDILLHVVKW